MSKSPQSKPARFLTADAKGPRDEQQDAAICLSDPEQSRALLVVSDGVGGNIGGRLASQCVVELVRDYWNVREGIFSDPAADLAAICKMAHEKIVEEGQKRSHSPRATVVALYLTTTEAHWAHSGDSRLYHFRSGKLIERTEDHSVTQILVKQGTLEEKEMGSHPSQGILLQSLGGEEFTPPALGNSQVVQEDGFLLCTDGFWERTSPEEMAELVFCQQSEAASILERAVERAVERNGPKGDNVTVTVALPIAETSSELTKKGSSRRLILLVAVVLLALSVLLIFLLLVAWKPLERRDNSGPVFQPDGCNADSGLIFGKNIPSRFFLF
jgi:PPM family protein phosphatase